MSEQFEMVEVGDVGTLAVAADLDGVYLCDWVHGRHDFGRYATHVIDRAATLEVAIQLREYLCGQRQQFSVPLAPMGTAFQQQVWDALQRIPYSATVTYSAVASAIGRPSAVRAVATAVAANPLSILIPCHRVLPAGGGIGDYAGGVAAKRFLLQLERDSAAL